MMMNRKYVGPIRHTKQGDLHSGLWWGVDGAPTVDVPGQSKSDSLFSLISLSENSERELPASERENGW